MREYLDLARVEGPGLALDPQSRVDVVADVIAMAVDMVQPQMQARGMHLVVDAPPSLAVCCDPTLLRIVIVNLLDNAVKYGDEGGEIRVADEAAEARRGRRAKLRVSVWNEGPGFAPAQRNKLFRRFSRLDDPALKARRGTGVGLYNAWRIVHLHDGDISAESKQGEWAKFCFEIPSQADCRPVAATTGAQT